MKIVETPVIWLGHDLDHQVKVWKDISECNSLMVNAFQLYSMPLVLKKSLENSIHNHMDYHGNIFMDSGGFQFQKNGNTSITTNELLEIYLQIKPSIAAILDVPLDPMISDDQNESRWRQTLENTAQMVLNKRERGIIIAPVLHAYDLINAKKRGEQLRQIITDPEVICIGSLVPLVKGSYIGDRFNDFSIKLSKLERRWVLISQLVTFVKQLFPTSMIHVFGVGSLSVMYLLFLLGVDSVDSISWRLKAGYGSIQLPGIGDRYFNTNQEKGKSYTRKVLTKNEYAILEECKCPVCYGYTIKVRERELKASFYSRALHNAHVSIKEVNLLRNIKTLEKRLEFVERRLQSHPYRRLLDTIISPTLENMCYNNKR